MAENKLSVDVKKLNLAGLFIALGVIIPYFTAHGFGIQGTVFLPMHIPVLMAGLLLGWRYGIIVGILAPSLSSLVTGMPALWPQFPMLASELVVFGCVAGLLRKKLKLSLYVALILAMISGRVIGAGVLALVLTPPNFQVFIALITERLVTGLSGIAIQLAFIPALVTLLERAFGKIEETEGEDYATREPTVKLTGFETNKDAIARAITGIEAGKFGFAVIKNDVIIYEGKGRGVSSLLELASTEEGLRKLEDALVVDRIIGKAAAMIIVLGKATHAYGLTMSKSGEEYLQAFGIKTKNNRCVDAISDRTGRGICPMERSVMEIDSPIEGVEKLQKTLAALRSKIS
jgi:uncharacterized membrane protein